jgi:F-type H+-transporting ATPase subunit epsilon
MSATSGKLQIDVVTPSRKLLVGEEVESVTIPTQTGEIMVLPGHTELVTILDAGGLYLQKPEGMRKFAVSYGFGVVRDNKVTILAETCEEAHEIDRERADMAEKKASEFLLETVEDLMLDKYRLKLKRAQVRKQIAEASDR